MNNPENLRFPPNQPVVLVAEDDVLIRNIARIILENDGYGVLTADDGEEALFLSRQFPQKIDLLLTDILMPRMTGLELALHIAEERPDTKVLVMSGTHHPGNGVQFLPKPFAPAALRETVARMLNGQRVAP